MNQKLINKAKKRYKIIYPLTGRTLEECFTVYDGYVYFWFNDDINSTHVVKTLERG